LRWRAYATMASNGTTTTAQGSAADAKPKLHGRAFYESIGSPKFVVAPMVDQSEFVSVTRREKVENCPDTMSRRGACSPARS
jgi:hypothetical protein